LKSWGRYVDEETIEITSSAVPIEISLGAFSDALRNRPKGGKGIPFKAVIEPEETERVKIRSK
jgi:hypothetical protein